MFIEIEGLILPGCVSVVESQCGNASCACKADPPKLHGPFYRWTGVLNGKRTTKTISGEVARECERRIKNNRKLQAKIDKIREKGLKNAPWNDG